MSFHDVILCKNLTTCRYNVMIGFLFDFQDDILNRNFFGLSDDFSKEIENEPFVFPDTQSRVKGFNSDRLSNLNEQANARFLFNFLSSDGTYTNPFFKTATFTSTVSVSVTSVVNCVPANQMLNGAAAIACNRKKRSVNDDLLLEENPLFIDPSETYKYYVYLLYVCFFDLADFVLFISRMTPTVSSSSYDPRFHQLLSSSKNDEITTKLDSREKRFLFANKNQFVVSTTVTSVSFTRTTATVTRNLLNPPPPANCIAQAAAAVAPAVSNPQCVACLPAGYIVCPATG
jgi:hypothetical protein